MMHVAKPVDVSIPIVMIQSLPDIQCTQHGCQLVQIVKIHELVPVHLRIGAGSSP